MDQLGGKAYQSQFEFTPEIVILFLPGETLFSTALQHDLQMIESGLQKRVLLASPITLIALLTTIAHTWRQEALEENARDISRLGQQLHDGLRAMAGHLDDLRKRIDGSVQFYNKVVGSFETNVLSKARQLKEKQMVTGEDLPRLESVDASPRLLRDAPLLGVAPSDIVDADAVSSDEAEESQ
jgi:DNA recombination protein RmuC